MKTPGKLNALLVAATAAIATPNEGNAATIALDKSIGVQDKVSSIVAPPQSITATPEAVNLGNLEFNTDRRNPNFETSTTGYDFNWRFEAEEDLSGVVSFDLSAYENSFNAGQIDGFKLIGNGETIPLTAVTGGGFFFTTGGNFDFNQGNEYSIFIDHNTISSSTPRRYDVAETSSLSDPSNDSFSYTGTRASHEIFGPNVVALGDAASVDIYVNPVPEPSSTVLVGLGALAMTLRRKRG